MCRYIHMHTDMHAHKYAKSFLYVEVMKQNPFLQVILDQLVQI